MMHSLTTASCTLQVDTFAAFLCLLRKSPSPVWRSSASQATPLTGRPPSSICYNFLPACFVSLPTL